MSGAASLSWQVPFCIYWIAAYRDVGSRQLVLQLTVRRGTMSLVVHLAMIAGFWAPLGRLNPDDRHTKG